MDKNKVEKVIYLVDEIKWFESVMDSILEMEYYTSEEVQYRKQAVNLLAHIIEIKKEQLEDM